MSAVNQVCGLGRMLRLARSELKLSDKQTSDPTHRILPLESPLQKLFCNKCITPAHGCVKVERQAGAGLGPGFGLGVRVTQTSNYSILSTMLCQGSSPKIHKSPAAAAAAAGGSTRLCSSRSPARPRLAAGKSPAQGSESTVLPHSAGLFPEQTEPAQGEAAAVCFAQPCTIAVLCSLSSAPEPGMGTTFPRLLGQVTNTSSGVS